MFIYSLTRLCVSGKHIPTGKFAPIEPSFTKVAWKATKMVEKRTKWALIWAKDHDVEIISTPHGELSSNCNDI